jgi:hypothetical protein
LNVLGLLSPCRFKGFESDVALGLRGDGGL